ncbi:hypothetical protein ANN_17105 [Periplaneta americana]|uniref:Transposase Tc1-like domain-containing protein n=1 Tax=Periplaneta americana TaxID=6978 RepID=A0ABQ8SSL3_PERAM|nr:hypothetical protein ANN_17105 [Periplaneta americana]
MSDGSDDEIDVADEPRSLTGNWLEWAGTVATSITEPNPLDLFLWGDMKCLVYETPIDTAEDLVARVVETARVIRDNVSLFERRRHSIVRRLTAVDLTRELMVTTGADIHVTTVRRRLLEAGRRARKPIKKQLLTPVMCKKRLMWAKLHQHWTVNDWKNVLFSDESHFEVHGHRVSYVRKGSEKPLILCDKEFH